MANQVSIGHKSSLPSYVGLALEIPF